jgi:hypothetical protein
MTTTGAPQTRLLSWNVNTTPDGAIGIWWIEPFSEGGGAPNFNFEICVITHATCELKNNVQNFKCRKPLVFHVSNKHTSLDIWKTNKFVQIRTTNTCFSIFKKPTRAFSDSKTQTSFRHIRKNQRMLFRTLKADIIFYNPKTKAHFVVTWN